VSSAREKQVRRALAAERSRQKRPTDAELAAYRRWIRRAIPWVLVLNFAMIVLLIWQGIYGAIAANLTVMPMLWLCWWLIRIAEARDAAPPPPTPTRPMVGPWANVGGEQLTTDDEPLDDGPTHTVPGDCIYTDKDECVICGAKHPFHPSNVPVRAKWPHPLDNA
jgi:hypothetical protein